MTRMRAFAIINLVLAGLSASIFLCAGRREEALAAYALVLTAGVLGDAIGSRPSVDQC